MVGIEIRSERNLLGLAATFPSEVWVYLVCGGEEGGVSGAENSRELTVQLLSQVLPRRLQRCGVGKELYKIRYYGS